VEGLLGRRLRARFLGRLAYAARFPIAPYNLFGPIRLSYLLNGVNDHHYIILTDVSSCPHLDAMSSLSCKELFGLFGTIVKHKDLEFSRLLRIRNPILCMNSQDVLRNQLLLRLENCRWAYCAKCLKLKLHPWKELTRHQGLLRKSALKRSCP
jgi:hypothetical protein